MRLTSEDVAAVLAASTAERPLTPDRQDVRVVGPSFLPEQEQLDLKARPPSLIRYRHFMPEAVRRARQRLAADQRHDKMITAR
jgi:hypothetical protein